jgi:hypothetical protein
MSAQETAAALNNAAIQLGEALGVTQDAQHQAQGAAASVEGAVSMVAAAKGDIESETLNSYLAVLHDAQEDLSATTARFEEAMTKIRAGLELGEQYANILHS